MVNYIYITMAKIDETSGVYKKIVSQTCAFENRGYSGEIFFVNDNDCVQVSRVGNITQVNFEDVKKSIFKRKDDIAFAYVRFELLRHKRFFELVKTLKQNQIKIIAEIPTFPPYQESIARATDYLKRMSVFRAIKTFVGAGIVAIDTHRFANFADLLCIVANDFTYRNVNCLRIENGIDLKKNPYNGVVENDAIINIVAVSNFAVWNGYDRAIKGLRNYIDQTGMSDIHLIFVGPIEKDESLLKLTKMLKLEEYVKFTGALAGEALDNIYNMSNVALGALGNHRRKVKANSSLKAKEYSARGKIMILAENEGIENYILDRSFIVNADESSIDFVEFKKWYYSIDNKKDISLDIYNFAKQNFSWDVQIDKILDRLTKIS